jgi:hypothetical protein
MDPFPKKSIRMMKIKYRYFDENTSSSSSKHISQSRTTPSSSSIGSDSAENDSHEFDGREGSVKNRFSPRRSDTTRNNDEGHQMTNRNSSDVVRERKTSSSSSSFSFSDSDPSTHQCTVVRSFSENPKSDSTEFVLLDSQANTHLFSSKLHLMNVRTAKRPITVTGIGGDLRLTKVGDLPVIGAVYYHKEVGVNILSLSLLETEGIAKVHYNTATGFKVDFGNRRVMVFERVDNLYKASTELLMQTLNKPTSDDSGMVFTTVRENLKRFNAREKEGALKAREVKHNLGHPSDRET